MLKPGPPWAEAKRFLHAEPHQHDCGESDADVESQVHQSTVTAAVVNESHP